MGLFRIKPLMMQSGIHSERIGPSVEAALSAFEIRSDFYFSPVAVILSLDSRSFACTCSSEPIGRRRNRTVDSCGLSTAKLTINVIAVVRKIGRSLRGLLPRAFHKSAEACRREERNGRSRAGKAVGCRRQATASARRVHHPKPHGSQTAKGLNQRSASTTADGHCDLTMIRRLSY